jgi:adenylate cyclase class 2
MKPEIEVKFLNIDFEEIRGKLRALGAVCEHPMRLMQRAVMSNLPELHSKDGFVRVRNEGHRTTLTYKKFNQTLGVDGAQEIETVVGDFDANVAILERCGVTLYSLQESKRETWRLGEVEIVLDEWPWLNPYIEIEGESQESLHDAAQKLGLNWERDAVFGDVMVAYRAQYPHLSANETVGNLASVRFDDPAPAMLTR